MNDLNLAQQLHLSKHQLTLQTVFSTRQDFKKASQRIHQQENFTDFSIMRTVDSKKNVLTLIIPDSLLLKKTSDSNSKNICGSFLM